MIILQDSIAIVIIASQTFWMKKSLKYSLNQFKEQGYAEKLKMQISSVSGKELPVFLHDVIVNI